MINRNPEPGKEGRMKWTPEGGGPAVYGKLEMADNPSEEGTYLTKETLLDDEASSDLQLNPDTSTPNLATKKLTQMSITALAAAGTTAGTSTAYTLTVPKFALVDGATVRIKLHVDSGATPTLNVNNTGAKALMTDKYTPLQARVAAGTWLTFTYSSTLGFFVSQGSKNKKNRNGCLSDIMTSILGFSAARTNMRRV